MKNSIKIKWDKRKIKGQAALILLLLVGALFRSFSLHSFIVPNDFAPGGVTGIAAMVEFLSVKYLPFKINSGIALFVLNIPFFILAAIFINKSFALKTGFSILFTSLLLLLWEKVQLPQMIGADSGERILAALLGGVLGGVGLAIIFKIGGSSGGTDIIATIIQKKYSATNVAWFIFVLDATVVIASVFVYSNGLVPLMLAFIEMFASSKSLETISQGFKSAIKFEIVTMYPEELSADIISKLNRGVTMTKVMGMYTHEEKGLLICIVRKRQVSQLRAILKSYPDSFAYIASTSEVMGQGFSK